MWDQATTQLMLSVSEKDMEWMTKPCQLATALKRVCTNLSVRILYQGSGIYSNEERTLLAVDDTHCYVREVLLEGDGVPFCFARTVVPIRTYQKYKKQFDTLGNQLLGDTLLYPGASSTARSDFQYAVIDSTHPYFLKSKVLEKQNLGARCSIFSIDVNSPLLIIEVFLPKIPVYKPGNTNDQPAYDTNL